MLSRVGAFLLLIGWATALAGAEPTEDARLGVLERLVRDESPRVRVEALRALAKIPTARSAELALGVLEKPMDATLDYALWLTINDLAEPWIGALQSGAWTPVGRERQLEFGLQALPPDQAGRALASVLGDRALPRDGTGPWIEVIGSAGSSADLRRLFDQAVEGGFDEAATARALRALAEAGRLRQLRPGGDLAGVAPFLRHPSKPVRIEALRLAGLWRDVGPAEEALLERLGVGAALDREEAGALFEALRQRSGERVIEGLRAAASTAGDPTFRRSAAVALAAMDGTAGFPLVADAGATLANEAEALAYWRLVMGIKGASLPLQEVLRDRRIPEAAGRAGMRVAREGGRDDLELAMAFARAGGIPTDPAELTGAMIKEVAEKVVATGDPRRGEKVYRKPELACVTCHAIGGAGGKVGPDLTSVGASAPVDYLVESLLLPNAKIKEGYHSVIVETRDGEEVSGTLARETPDELYLRNASGQEVAIAKRGIARRETGRLSLMPSGLLEPLEEPDRLDLVAFLSQLGKPGEYDASRGGVVRLWRVANVVHTDLQNDRADWYWTAPLDGPRWVPLLSLVNGTLPRDLLNDALKAQAWTARIAVVLAGELELRVAGPVRFGASMPEAEVWVERQRWGEGGSAAGELPAGRHRWVVKLDPRRLPEAFRLEVAGATLILP